MLRTQKGGNAELDDGCSGSRFDELRLLQVQTVYAPQTEQLAMRQKCIKDHTCIHNLDSTCTQVIEAKLNTIGIFHPV